MQQRRLSALLFLLLLAATGFASKKEKKAETSLRRVGIAFRSFNAPEGYNWRGSDERSLSAVIWYPAESSAEEKEMLIGDPPLFNAGRAAKDAVMAPSFGTYPLIALSHGTGGSALQLAWLGTYLASRGYIVVAVNHPGNNAVSGYQPQGFVEWWLRAVDLRVAIDEMLADTRFGSKIDRERIGTAGFSLGGYTMMEIAGATTNFPQILTWCEQPEHISACSPPEMPDLVERFEAIKHQSDVEAEVRHAGDSYRDARVKAVFAIAPGVARAFAPESLHAIKIPVAIVAGDGDKVVAPSENAKFFADHIPGSQLTMLPGGVGHYTFLDVGTDLGKKEMQQLFVDAPGVDREAVHKQVAEMAADFFERAMTASKKPKKR